MRKAERVQLAREALRLAARIADHNRNGAGGPDAYLYDQLDRAEALERKLRRVMARLAGVEGLPAAPPRRVRVSVAKPLTPEQERRALHHDQASALFKERYRVAAVAAEEGE